MSQFTPAEIEVMQILWEHGELKPAQIQIFYPHPIKNAALRFQLRILLEKKHVARRLVGKAYFYRALTPREGTFRKMARRMADIFCRGSAVGLIAEMIKAERLTPDQVRELQRYAVPPGPAPAPRRKPKPKAEG